MLNDQVEEIVPVVQVISCHQAAFRGGFHCDSVPMGEVVVLYRYGVVEVLADAVK